MSQNQAAAQPVPRTGGAGRMVRHSSIYALGNIAGQLVGFVMLPIYTRYLTPADYGVVGLLLFAVSLIELVFGARMARVLPRFYYEQEEQTERHAVISTALLITSAASGLAMAALLLLREPVSQGLFGSSEYGLVVGLFALLILGHALENYGLQYVRMQQRPWLFISLNLVKLVLQLSLNIWFVVVQQQGVLGIALSSAISSAVFSLALAGYTTAHTGLRFNSALARRLLAFTWPLWIAGLAGLYIGSANRYYIRIFSSLEEVGLYELAIKFSTIITLLIWRPFNQYWQTERFVIYRQPDPLPVFQNVFRFVSLLMVLAALGIALFAGPVIRIMADAAFHRAEQAVPFLVFGAVFSSLTLFSNFSFLVKDKTGWMSQNEYLTAAIVTVFYLLLIPAFGFVGAAVALMLAQGAQFIIVHRRARAHYDMGISLLPLAFNLLVAALGYTASRLLQSELLPWDLAMRLAVFLCCAVIMLAGPLRDPALRRQLIGLLPLSKNSATR